jgi:hypothetical protein
MKTFILLLLLLSSCGRPTPPVLTPDARYEIPVEPVKHVTPDSGRKETDIIAVVTIPTATIVTDATGTHLGTVNTVVKVYREKKTLRETLLRHKDEPKTPIDVVTNNPEVTVSYPEIIPWWWYALSVLIVAVILWEMISRIFETISGPIKLIRKIL